MSWICKNCETMNYDDDCICVVCNSVAPNIQNITVDYQKEIITWTNNNVRELNIKYSQGVFNVTGLTSFHISISAIETIVFIADNDVAERIFCYKLSEQSVQNVIILKEDNNWQQASRQNTVESYKDYLKAYPDGPHAKDAKRIISELEDDNSWKVACSKDTLQSYRSYLIAFPSGRHTEECKRRVIFINDNKAWKTALVENTVESFEQYLKRFPNPLHASEARERIEKLSKSSSAWGWFAAVVLVIITLFSMSEFRMIDIGLPRLFPPNPTVISPPGPPSPKPDYSAEIRKTHTELDKLFNYLEDSKNNGYHPNPDGLSEIRKRINRLENLGDSSVGKYKDRLILLTKD